MNFFEQLLGNWDHSSYWFTRFFFQRSLGLIYVIAFLVAIHQFTGLCGEKGLLPAQHFLGRVEFRESPSLFFFHFSDRFALTLAWTGFVLAVAALTGLSDAFGLWTSIGVWFSLWLL